MMQIITLAFPEIDASVEARTQKNKHKWSQMRKGPVHNRKPIRQDEHGIRYAWTWYTQD